MTCEFESTCTVVPCATTDCLYRRRALRYFKESNLDLPFRTFTKKALTANADKAKYKRLVQIENNIVQWVANGQNLVIHSTEVGNGKSTWARRLLVSYFEQVLEQNRVNAGLYMSVDEFFDRQRDEMSEADDKFLDLKQRMLCADLVVLDDLGTSQLTEFCASSLTNIVDTRLNRQLSTIYTTNLIPKSTECERKLGIRLSSRALDTAELIEFIEKSKRRYGRAANLI